MKPLVYNVSDKTGSGFISNNTKEEEKPLSDGDPKLCPLWIKIDKRVQPKYNSKTNINFEKEALSKL